MSTNAPSLGVPDAKAVQIFRHLLREKKVDPYSTWRQELPKLVGDRRYDILPSLADKRRVFEHFAQEMKEKDINLLTRGNKQPHAAGELQDRRLETVHSSVRLPSPSRSSSEDEGDSPARSSSVSTASSSSRSTESLLLSDPEPESDVETISSSDSPARSTPRLSPSRDDRSSSSSRQSSMEKVEVKRKAERRTKASKEKTKRSKLGKRKKGRDKGKKEGRKEKKSRAIRSRDSPARKKPRKHSKRGKERAHGRKTKAPQVEGARKDVQKPSRRSQERQDEEEEKRTRGREKEPQSQIHISDSPQPHVQEVRHRTVPQQEHGKDVRKRPRSPTGDEEDWQRSRRGTLRDTAPSNRERTEARHSSAAELDRDPDLDGRRRNPAWYQYSSKPPQPPTKPLESGFSFEPPRQGGFKITVTNYAATTSQEHVQHSQPTEYSDNPSRPFRSSGNAPRQRQRSPYDSSAVQRSQRAEYPDNPSRPFRSSGNAPRQRQRLPYDSSAVGRQTYHKVTPHKRQVVREQALPTQRQLALESTNRDHRDPFPLREQGGAPARRFVVRKKHE